MLPGGPVQAQDNGPIEYAENDTGPVATYTAQDPEGKEIRWSLAADGDDEEFDISDGVLSFKSPPDFEAATGGQSDDSNTYTVTVQASAGGSATAEIQTVTRSVMVTVTNVDERGTVMLSTLQPQVGVQVTATLSEPDNPDPDATLVTDLAWQWYRGATEIPGADSATFSPVDGDVGSVLVVKATYKDAEDSEAEKSAEVDSAYVVRAAPETNIAPVFPDEDIADDNVLIKAREVAEDAPAGRSIGAPVVATDPGDVLTYSLSGTDAVSFDIDRATGQLKTKADLDHETTPSYSVIVTATDPFMASTGVTGAVTIDVTDVNEAPTITGSPASALTFAELDETTPLPTYAATDEDRGADNSSPDTLTWSKKGADAGKFDLSDGGVLTFKSTPDYESPGDANRDNDYELTVVVSDGKGNSDEHEVTVSVTNVMETGTVTFSTLQPRVGVELTAELDDSDGSITALMWVWSKGGTDIEDATSATYTPVAADIGATLTATATYKDGQSGTAERTADEATENMVIADTDNKPPKFPDQDMGTEGDQTDQEREVDENTDAGEPIGVDDPVTATDANTGDRLTYTLGDAGAASFDIVAASGQLQTKAALDYEDKQTYAVTVTATDSLGETATARVTIKVMDVDEVPELDGQASAQYAENDTGLVATYTAQDPERKDIVWSLDGDDAADFTIVGGVLRFMSSPDFESPADGGTDNTYSITVQASAGASDVAAIRTDSQEVTVTVTNANEPGTVKLSTVQPQVEVQVTATLSDDDVVTNASVNWVWFRGGNRIAGSESSQSLTATYTPAGRSIGAPVVATDPGDVLTYSLGGTDEASFDIDRATGQLKTKAALNHEAIGGDSYTVTVTATDPFGRSAVASVTIAVTDVNEAPTITDSAEATLSFAENANVTTELADYAASDEDESPEDTLTWSKTGADAGKFELTSDGGVLTFESSPDYESPGDANGDNDYKLTVVVSDGKGKSDEHEVTVSVTNVLELGTVTFSTLQPRVGVALTAELDDDDGSITGRMWAWTTSGTPFEEVPTSATYTPVAADIGDTLTATATYKDGQSGATERTATASAANMVIADTRNKPPKFPDRDADTEGEQTDQDREVAENIAAAPIGVPVTATDKQFATTSSTTADDDTLTYTLGGVDAASFDIDAASGQLQTKAALNKEEKDTYMVEVTATDPSGLTATVNVTIKVGDVDEAPTIMEGGLAISGKASIDYAENGTDAVETYSAAGPDAAEATWSLSGADMGDFNISGSGGVFSFATSPDFESPADADTDNVYELTVEADDGTNTATRSVTVTVTDVDEDGTTGLAGDTNNDGMIDKTEVIKAFRAYVDGQIDKAQIIKTFRQYVADSAGSQ